MKYSPSIAKLIDEFASLPGIGRKSAVKLAFHVVEISKEDAFDFAEAVLEVKRNIKFCEKCFNITDEEYCGICLEHKRDSKIICVVENPRDLMAIEKTQEYYGLYHVLHGHISPMDGIGPEDIKVRELLMRLETEEVEEILLATNPTIEGEATAMYISKLLKVLDIKVTRLAHGIPIGGDLEFADEMTLAKSIEGRRTL